MARTLYRFLPSQYALLAIQEGRLKVGMPNELNDPYDCLPRFEGIEGEIGDQASIHALNFFSCYHGLLCYCKSIENPVVWSHYADAHRGIVLGIEYEDERDIIDIKYQDARGSIVNPAHSADNQEMKYQIDEDNIRHVFGIKATSWEYEQEARRVIALDQCDMLNELYYESFDRSSLRFVVLGARCQMGPPHIKRLLSKHGFTSVEIMQSFPNRDRYRMERKSVGSC